MINALLLAAMMFVESNGDAGAIGDGGRALGVLQIHAGVIADVNRRHGTDYKHEDALDPSKAIRICRLYLETYAIPACRGVAPERSREVLARIWNGGPNGHLKASTLKYWKKVAAKYRELSEPQKIFLVKK